MSYSRNNMLYLPSRHSLLWVLPEAFASLVDRSSFQALCIVGIGYIVVQWMNVYIHTLVFALNNCQDSFSCKWQIPVCLSETTWKVEIVTHVHMKYRGWLVYILVLIQVLRWGHQDAISLRLSLLCLSLHWVHSQAGFCHMVKTTSVHFRLTRSLRVKTQKMKNSHPISINIHHPQKILICREIGPPMNQSLWLGKWVILVGLWK